MCIRAAEALPTEVVMATDVKPQGNKAMRENFNTQCWPNFSDQKFALIKIELGTNKLATCSTAWEKSNLNLQLHTRYLLFLFQVA